MMWGRQRWRANGLAACVLLGLCMAAPAARAAELEGVRMPDSIEVSGKHLVMNGIGLRTFSFLKLGIYVAALYLEQRSHDARAIMDSPGTKVIDIHFIHDADAERVRTAWREGFDQDCSDACHLPRADVEAFLAAVPDLHQGDICRMLYTQDFVSIAVNGRVLGKVTQPAFMRVLLATFLGPHPPTERLKRELLGGTHD